MGATVLLVPLIGVELMPETDEGEVRIRVEMPTGTRIESTDEVDVDARRKRISELSTFFKITIVVGRADNF